MGLIAGVLIMAQDINSVTQLVVLPLYNSLHSIHHLLFKHGRICETDLSPNFIFINFILPTSFYLIHPQEVFIFIVVTVGDRGVYVSHISHISHNISRN